jgi:hypothetical protein
MINFFYTTSDRFIISIKMYKFYYEKEYCDSIEEFYSCHTFITFLFVAEIEKNHSPDG